MLMVALMLTGQYPADLGKYDPRHAVNPRVSNDGISEGLPTWWPAGIPYKVGVR